MSCLATKLHVMCHGDAKHLSAFGHKATAKCEKATRLREHAHEFRAWSRRIGDFRLATFLHDLEE